MRPKRIPPSRILVAAAMLALLGILGLSSRPSAAAPGDTVTQAVQKGIDYLTFDAVTWAKNNDCMACHRQGAALMGLALARSSGYTVNLSDTNGLGYLASRVLRYQNATGGWNTVAGPVTTTSYALAGEAIFNRYVSSQYTDQMIKGADYAVRTQTAAGHWNEDYGHRPTNYGLVPVTARMMLALSLARFRVDPATAATYEAALAKAAAWLRANKDNQDDRVMRNSFQIGYALIGLDAAGATADDLDVQFLVNRLLTSTSTPTGKAWGYLAASNADEFNTGLALYGLGTVGVDARSNQTIQDAMNWLNERQVNHPGTGGGYWNAPGFGSVDVPTTFALLGLSVFGELGLRLEAIPPDKIILRSNFPESQTVTFNLKIRNTGAFQVEDTYDLQVLGGLPGWSAVVAPDSVTLQSGDETQIAVSVTAPPSLPVALPVDWTVVATSRENPDISAFVRLITQTDPPPPPTGHESLTTFTAGPGGSVIIGKTTATLSATVKDKVADEALAGPDSGVVTFQVAGIAVGVDNDPDGDGVYTMEWAPDANWTALGSHDLRAIYSGIDRAEGDDVKGSSTAANIQVDSPAVLISDVDPNMARPGDTLTVEIRGRGFAPDATVEFGPGITVLPPDTGDAGSSTTNSITVRIAVAQNAAPGPRDVTVRNPNGDNDTAARVFLVGFRLPDVTAVTPSSVQQGKTTNVVLQGSGFVQGATVDFGEGITVNSATVSSRGKRSGLQSDHILTVNITIAEDAPPGSRDVTVTNPDGGTMAFPDLFTIAEAPDIALIPSRETVEFRPTAAGDAQPEIELRVKNEGNKAFVGTVIPPKGPFTLNCHNMTFRLPAGATMLVRVKFNPKRKGTYRGKIVFVSKDRSKRLEVPVVGRSR